VKDIVECFEGYKNRDWDKLKKELKGFYWQHDRQRDSTATLNRLVSNAGKMDLNVFILKYTSISKGLVAGGTLAPLDQINRFLKGLSEEYRERALRFCMKRNWRLSVNDTGTKAPVFEELKEFVWMEAQVARKRMVYESEVVSEVASEEGSGPNSTSPSIASTKEAISAHDEKVTDLAKKIDAMTLILESIIESQRSASVASTTTAQPPRKLRCVWCDSPEHNKRGCSELSAMARRGQLRLNEQGRVIDAVTGEELPAMFSRGGMKRVWKPATPQPATATISQITIEEKGSTYKGEDRRDNPADTPLPNSIDTGVGVLQRRGTAEGETRAEGEITAEGETAPEGEPASRGYRIREVSETEALQVRRAGKDVPNQILCWKPGILAGGYRNRGDAELGEKMTNSSRTTWKGKRKVASMIRRRKNDGCVENEGHWDDRKLELTRRSGNSTRG
jgi:hypothetical protein